MSHHPSSAELAAFRRSIAYNRDGQAHATALAFGYVPRAIGVKAPGQWHAPTLSHDGTRPEELQDGIGYRMRHEMIVRRLSTIRREASALRSRAYARLSVTSWDPTADADRSYPYGIPTDRWDDDEPRHPLPVRYQPAFIITR